MNRFGISGDAHDAELVVGDEASRAAAREEHRREERVRLAHKGPWQELRRSDLKIRRYGFVVDSTTGLVYRVKSGEVFGSKEDGVDAVFFDQDGEPVFLQQPPHGPRTVAELEQRQAARPSVEPRRRRRRLLKQ